MSNSESPRTTLLFDADDTLWENNIYFEQAITAFISYLDHRVHSEQEVREHLNLCERITIAQYGYGVASFRRSLVRCFEDLTDEPLSEQKHQRIVSFADAIATEQIELLPDALETLQDLARRNRLLLVTKGDETEQKDKLKRSGLQPFFSAIEVPREKNVEMYRALVTRHALSSADTWMIGNSPRSDVNAALEAGLNAVFIPHDTTWSLEHEAVIDVPEGQTLLELRRLRELLHHF